MERARLLRIAARVANVPAKEGQFSAPDGQVLAHLQKYLGAKYVADAAYRSFADRVRGPWRDSLQQHWAEHAGEERRAAYDLAMKVSALGGDPSVSSISVPTCTASLPGLMQCLIDLELDAIENGRALIAMAGSNTAMVVLAENLVLQDTQHLDDLRRMAARSEL